MLKKMRWRFIGAAMAAFTAVVLTLLCFHIGATVSFFAVDWLHVRGGLLVLPFVAWGYVLAVCERRHESLAEEPETIPDNTAYPSV